MNDKVKSKKQGRVNLKESVRRSKNPKTIEKKTTLLQENEELTILDRLIQKVTAQLSLQKACNVAVQEICVALGADAVGLFLQEGGELHLNAVRPKSSYLKMKTVPVHIVGECLCGLAAQTGRTITSQDIHKDIRCTWSECKKAGFHSFVAIPMRIGKEPVGVLGIASAGEREFKKNTRFLKKVADRLAISIQHARLFEQTQIYAIQLEQQIAEREKTEKMLQKNRSDLMVILDNFPFLAWLKDSDGRFIAVNVPFARASGHSAPEDLIGKTDLDIWPKNLAESYRADDNIVMLSRKKKAVEEIISDQGVDNWFETYKAPLFDMEGKVTGTTGFSRDITERRRAEKALQESEEKFRAITTTAVDAILVMDNDGKIIYWNPSAEEIFGYRSEEAIGQNLHAFLAPERYYGDYLRGFGRFKKTGEGPAVGNTLEFLALRKDGTEFPIEVSTSVIKINGKWCAVGIVRDITERKQAETALRESEARQKYILESVQAGILLIDAETHVITDVNPVAAHMIGSTREQLIGSICNRHVCPAEVGKCPITDLGHTIDNSDRILITAKGKRLSILKTVVPVMIHGRKHLLESFIDITERKQAEKEHLLNETRISSLLELSRMTDKADQVLTDFTLEKAIEMTGSTLGYLAFMNEDETVLTMYSWSRQAMKECLLETKPLVYPVEMTGLWGEAVRHRKPIITNDYEAPNPVKKGYPEGHVRVRRHMNIPLFDGERIVLVAGVGNKEEPYGESDIRQLTLLMDGMWKIIKQKRAKEELRKSEEAIYESYSTQSLINILLSESLKDETLELILQKALNMVLSIPWFPAQAHGNIFLVEGQPDMLIMKVKSDMNVTPCSQIPFGKCICGRAALSQEIVISHHPDERHECCHEELTPHVDYTMPIIYRGKTLGVIHINVNNKHNINQHMVEFLHSIANTLAGIIERKKVEQDRARLQAQLLQAQKMEAVGTLAGGIAHNVNNLLMGVLGYTSIMLMKTEKSHPFYDKLKTIEKQVESGSELTKQLLGFARGGRYEVKPIKVNDLIIKTSDMFGMTKKEITIHKKLQEDLLTIEADSGQLEQVLFNLYVNAWQAMPSGGTLYLETQNVMLDEQQCRYYKVESCSYIKISVTDTGIGMDAETQKRIFEPFFSTKDVDQGTGLGLASAYGIIKNHGGIINVYSEKGHGATFNLYLPVSDAKPWESRPSEGGLLTGNETILIVDDEPLNIDVIKALLEELGYKTLTAQSGEKAIELYKKLSKDIKLVILDMIMPAMNGKETLIKLMEIDKTVRVLLSSGYSINGEAKTILELGCKGFIQKPFWLDELSRKIRAVLDAGHA